MTNIDIVKASIVQLYVPSNEQLAVREKSSNKIGIFYCYALEQKRLFLYDLSI